MAKAYKPKKPSRRSVGLAKIRFEGYHGRSLPVAPVLDYRISLEAARVAYREGVSAKERGVLCNCEECRNAKVQKPETAPIP